MTTPQPNKSFEEFVEERLAQFNRQYVEFFLGGSGLGGNYPQEPGEEITAPPDEVRDFLRSSLRKAYELGRHDLAVEMTPRLDLIERISQILQTNQEPDKT